MYVTMSFTPKELGPHEVNSDVRTTTMDRAMRESSEITSADWTCPGR
jgi:hypothetical protein